MNRKGGGGVCELRPSFGGFEKAIIKQVTRAKREKKARKKQKAIKKTEKRQKARKIKREIKHAYIYR